MMRRWLGDLLERIGFTISEWRRPKPEVLTQREIREIVRQQHFERYITGTAKAE